MKKSGKKLINTKLKKLTNSDEQPTISNEYL